MISEPPAITQVQAVYSFKGKNNDELNFKKGDIITITQKEEGGWWEGTFEGKTGWFPSNYVKDIGLTGAKPPPTVFAVETIPEQQTVNRNLILKDIIDSEKSFISEIQTLIKTVLTPLGNSDILTADEYNKIVRNLPEIVDLHLTFVRLLEDCYEKPSLEQRVGNIFLGMAEKVKVAHTEYCSNHPRAVCILESYKEKLGSFVEGLGGRSPGLVFLTAGLSRPFRRLERYGGCLQELERHMEEFHPDRGDTQRSVFVYQNIPLHCASVRRQKEQELEVLCGSVRCWEGDEPQRLGELLYMGPVKITTTIPIPETKDRHLVLFSQCLILLSVSQRLSAFVFEKKYNLSGMSLNMQDDTELSRCTFELLVSGSERVLVSCPSKEERLRLVDLLQKQIRNPVITSPSTSTVACVSHPPFRLMTRYFALLIKAGLLTRLRLREILDGGKAEHERRLILGCTFISPSAIAEKDNLNRFLRQCRAECRLSTGQSDRSSTQTRSLYIEKFTLGVPLVVHSWIRSSIFSSSTSSTSSSPSSSPLISGAINGKMNWPREGFGGSLDSASLVPSKSPKFPFRSQSLPPLDLCITRYNLKEASVERAEGPVQQRYTSTTVDAWVSNFSFDSGLADVGGATPSRSRDATDTPSERDTSDSSLTSPVYRSTLYAHWWRKAKVSAALILAESPALPFPSPTGKGDGIYQLIYFSCFLVLESAHLCREDPLEQVGVD
uniref:Rho guanine nucleotide exchange factor n=1 Tax=Daphnia magna TaxID=35525 RepID=A0A0P5BWA1_9CRUS